MTTLASSLVNWSQEEGGWIGRGPSGALWQVTRDCGAWSLSGGNCDRHARATSPKPLMDSVVSAEAMKLVLAGGSLEMMNLEALLKARAFAIAQREALLEEMRAAGFDPTGVAGPREEWMAQEIQGCQKAVDAFESAAVSAGWKPTVGS